MNIFRKKEQNYEDMKTLTQEYAEKRAKQVKSKTVSYDLVLNLREGECFDGKVQITFEVTKIKKNDIFIDFSGYQINVLKINRHTIKIVEWNGKFLKLKRNYLIENGVNMVEIIFKNKYSNNGCGLHSYIDPRDQNQYLYSQCEAYYCNMIFPNFDQPDIKARLLLTVNIPKKWTFIANESAKSIVEQNLNKKIEFNPTAYISTYLYAFIAGPYHQISLNIDDNNDSHCDIPMSLYCRQTQKQSLQKQKDFIFDTTCKGIQFFEKFFQYKYPFTKYDQIFCPEFNSGAMENVGAVTFNDNYLFQEEVDIQKLSSFANTIIHELAHMWFGNLVTMKWWNDLWLNESFADFISHFCLSKIAIPKFESIRDNVWLQFNMRKSWGYREDQLSTTHPIAGKVANTDIARTIFDGITYAKGAATIKQLLFAIGEDIFSQSLAQYFGKHAFNNATLIDFMTSLSQCYLKVKKMEFDFKYWQKQHIQTAGLNVVEPLFSQQTSQNSLTIVQSCALQMHPHLRRHKMKICFFDDNATMHDQTIYILPQIDTVIKYRYPFQIRAVLLNFEDHAFVKVILDPESLTFFKKNLHYIHDDLTRTLIWRSLFEMVRDARISSEDYLDIFKRNIINERTDSIVINQFMFMRAVLVSFTPPQYQEKYSEDMFNFTKNYMKANLYSKNKTIALRPYLTSLVKEQQSINLVEQSYIEQLKNSKPSKNQPVLAEIGLRSSNVVSLIHSSAFHSREQKRKFYESYLLTNNTIFNQGISQKCLIQDYSLKECEYLWLTFVQYPQTKSLKMQENAMSSFNLQNQYPQFTNEWFFSLEQIFKQQSKEYASLFFEQLFPRDEDLRQIQARLRVLLEKVEKEQKQQQSSEHAFLLIKKIKIALDDLERKINAHAKFVSDQEKKIKPSL